jgi:hypothetical protein
MKNGFSRRRASAEQKETRWRSAVTNGRRLHVIAPTTNAWTRRYRDVFDQIISDISGGAPEILSEGQKQLCRRATTIAIACERLECRAAEGKKIDLEIYGKLADRLGRTFHRLGLKRQARDVTPTLDQYIATKQHEAAG